MIKNRMRILKCVAPIMPILLTVLITRMFVLKYYSQKLEGDLKRLAVELSETRQSLVQSALHYNRIGQHIKSVNNIIKSLGEETITQYENSTANKSSSENSTSYPGSLFFPPAPGGGKKRDPGYEVAENYVSKKEVCPEKYIEKGISSAFDWPFFRKGFERVKCKEFVPINRLVTLVVILPQDLSPKENVHFFQSLEQYYPSIGIVLASKSKFHEENVTKLNLTVKNIVLEDLTHGETWTKLLQEVTTPYVLLAPDVTHFNDDIDLERLVRVLSDNKDAIIAGGSFRNQQGEWDIGCLQVTFRNWTAYFRGGYYSSFSTECVVCDVLSGPFMAKTEGLREIRIDKRLPFGVFYDIFWRLKTEHPEKVVVSCPDVMFYTHSREVPDESYAALASKWEVKKWVEPNGRVRWYGCRHGYPHTRSDSCSGFKSGMGVPPCDLENLADAVKFTMKECEDAGLLCEIASGTLTGAVKFNKVLPWERDADIIFPASNFTGLKQLKSKFAAAGYSLTARENSVRCCDKDGRGTWGIVDVKTTRWRIELWGRYKVESEGLIESGLSPTKVQFAGQWVNVNRNPGLFVRNRYGLNVYKHAEHWGDLGHKTSWEFYKPGTFIKCPRPGHSACLDQFPVDGNIQFSNYHHN